MGKQRKEQRYAGSAYGRKKVKPKVRFRIIYIILIFVVCILVGLAWHMLQINMQ